jgi:alpha-1,3-glucan synthase
MASRRARRFFSAALALLSLSQLPAVTAAPYSDELADYNLNTNKAATDVLDYSTTRSNTTYTPSPDNWRSIPFYTLLPDKFADGDPSNNDYFGTMYEADWRETQMRYGGDLKGLVNKLDYLAGMGVKGIFMSGTAFINMPWQADSRSIRMVTRLGLTNMYRLLSSRFHGPRSSLWQRRRMAGDD